MSLSMLTLYNVCADCCNPGWCVLLAQSMLGLIDINSILAHLSQSGLYSYILNVVDNFRVFIGAPDTERFNLVLFGGTHYAPSNPHVYYIAALTFPFLCLVHLLKVDESLNSY